MFYPSGLDFLVNNAATLVFGEAAWQTVDQVAAQFTVNTLAPLQVFDSIQTLCPLSLKVLSIQKVWAYSKKVLNVKAKL
jgi:hypothetical protein